MEDTDLDQLVVIYSNQPALLGQSYALTGATALTVGRGTGNTILLDGDSVSRRHARFEKRGDDWWVVDLGSTNGTYVNDRQVTGAPLSGGDHIKVGGTIFRATASSSMASVIDEGRYLMSDLDGLTGLYNRRFFHAQLPVELARWGGGPARPLALVMVDLDHFKRLNDEYGHLVGDEVLRGIAATIAIYAAPGGLAVRYGGEEFALILPGVDGAEAAARAELLRAEVGGRVLLCGEHRVTLTLSAGVAQADDATRTAPSLIERADQRLYEAKRAGRDRVVA